MKYTIITTTNTFVYKLIVYWYIMDNITCMHVKYHRVSSEIVVRPRRGNHRQRTGISLLSCNTESVQHRTIIHIYFIYMYVPTAYNYNSVHCTLTLN